MQFSRYIWSYQCRIKWRIRDSNSWPPACKAGALPTELIPHIQFTDMGLSGLEPPTSRLSGVRSNQLSYKPILKSFDFSGDEEIRTLDPLLARQVLSQLSYIPIWSGSHLLSHTVSSAVPSADWVLTVVFGMGTGVSPNRIGTRNVSAW